jgi:hypothetical protein
MKDSAEEHRSSSKEDIKKAQPEKLVGDTPKKQLPNTDVPRSLLPGKPTEKSTRKNQKTTFIALEGLREHQPSPDLVRGNKIP